MKYTGDIKQVEKEIYKLECELNKINSLSRLNELTSSLYCLLVLYQVVEDINLENMETLRQKMSVGITDQLISHYYRKYFKNYKENFEFHGRFARSAFPDIGQFSWLADTEEKEINLDDKTCYQLMYDYLKKTNDENILEKLIRNRKIFLLEDKDAMQGCDGITFFSSAKNDYFVLLSKSGALNTMGVLIHEIGHIKDMELLKYTKSDSIVNYDRKSIYGEVISKYYEKRFYSFLINNGIFPADGLYNYYLNGFMNLINLDLFSRCVDEDNSFSLDADSIYSDLRCSLSYSYGTILANYFVYLEENDKDKYNDKFNIFMNNRDKLFDKRMLFSLENKAKDLIVPTKLAIDREKKIYQKIRRV